MAQKAEHNSVNCMEPAQLGRSPVSAFELRSSTLSLVNLKISVGIVPKRPRFDNVSCFKAVNSPMLVGIPLSSDLPQVGLVTLKLTASPSVHLTPHQLL